LPKVAIVILNWNGKSFLEKFLPSVVACNPDYAEIFVADNGSTDGSEDFLRQYYPRITYIPLGKNHGYTGGYNLALKQIDAQYYVLLNSDIEVTPGWIDPVIALMDANDDVAACQPRIMGWHQRDHFEYAGAAGGFIDLYGYPFCRGRLFETLEKDMGQYNDPIEIFWATGACMFVRAGDFHLAGAFDEDFFAHMEEIDLCWRLKRMGRKIMVCPDSIIYHVGGGTLPKTHPRKTFLNFRNNLLLLAKNLPASLFYPLLAKRMVLDQVAALRFLTAGCYKDFKAVYSALASVTTLYRIKRRQGREMPYMPVGQVYGKSIVVEYFIRKKKKFSQLNPENFRKL
jgi:GT2 family glycosyltransferase